MLLTCSKTISNIGKYFSSTSISIKSSQISKSVYEKLAYREIIGYFWLCFGNNEDFFWLLVLAGQTYVIFTYLESLFRLSVINMFKFLTKTK